MGNTEMVALADLAASTPGAIAIGPFGSKMKSDCYVEHGMPVVRGANLTGGRAWKNEFVYIPEELASSMPNCIAKEGDILFPHRGAIGEVGVTPKSDNGFMISSSLMKFCADINKASPLYLYYYFTSSSGKSEILRFSSQVGTPGIGQPLTSLRQFRVPYFPLHKQQAIASILGSLDDKIDLNRRMNETLESMARAIFKDWFVDFGPTRAKMEGRAPYLAREIWELFPDRLDDEGKPEGWAKDKLGQHVINYDSKRVPVSSSERAKMQGKYPYHGAASVMDHVNAYLFDGVFLLVGEDGSVIRAGGLGVTQYAWGKIWVNNHAHVLQGKGAVSTEQLYMYFQFEPVEPYVTGAVQPKLSQGRMNEMPFIFPGENVCLAFKAFVSSFFAKIRACAEESLTLAQTRDLLLPKLMSGEIRVKDAEKTVEEVL